MGKKFTQKQWSVSVPLYAYTIFIFIPKQKLQFPAHQISWLSRRADNSLYIHCVSKKVSTFKLSITLLNIIY